MPDVTQHTKHDSFDNWISIKTIHNLLYDRNEITNVFLISHPLSSLDKNLSVTEVIIGYSLLNLILFGIKSNVNEIKNNLSVFQLQISIEGDMLNYY